MHSRPGFLQLARECFLEISGVSLDNEQHDWSAISINDVFQSVGAAQPTCSSAALDSAKGSLQRRMESLFKTLGPVFTRLDSCSQEHSSATVLLGAVRISIATDPGSDHYIKRIKNLTRWTDEIRTILTDLPNPLPDDPSTLPMLSELFIVLIQILAHSMPFNRCFSLRPRHRLLRPFMASNNSQFAFGQFQETRNNLQRLVSDLQWMTGDAAEMLLAKWPSEGVEPTPCSRQDFEKSTICKINVEGKALMTDDIARRKRVLANMIKLTKLCHDMMTFLPQAEAFNTFPSSMHNQILRLQHAASRSPDQEFTASILQQMTNYLSVFEHHKNTHATRLYLVLSARSLLQTYRLLILLVQILEGSRRRLKLTFFSWTSRQSSLPHHKLSEQLSTLRTLTSSIRIGGRDESPLNSLWERAISKYKADTKFDLQTNSSVATITSLQALQTQVEVGEMSFIRDRVKDVDLDSFVTPVFAVLGQFAAAIGEGAQQGGLPGNKMVAGSISILLQAARDVQASNDFILELFKDLSAFLRRIRLQTNGARHPELQELLVEILCQFIIVMGATYKVTKQGCLRRWLSYVGGMQDKVEIEAREFKRLCSTLDSFLLTLLFEQALEVRSVSTTLVPSGHSTPFPLEIPAGSIIASQTNGGLCLLSLDGGGVKVVAELFVLQEIMHRLQVDLDLDEPLRPAQIFDMIAGTGTGGLIALFLGRLGMTVPEAIRAYLEVFGAVYDGFSVDVSKDRSELQVKTIRFEDKIKEIVGGYAHKAEASMIMASNASESLYHSKTFVCAMPANNMAHPRLFRTYNVQAMPSPNCAVWEAARVTTAMPGIFREMEIEDEFVSERFVDGGFRCNNPTLILMDEARNLWPDRVVSCLLSLGAGHPGPMSLHGSESELANLTRNICQGCEATANDAERLRQSRPELQNYWRFNTQQGLQGVSLEEWKRLSEMKSHVTSYVQQAQTDHQVSRVVEVLQRDGQKIRNYHSFDVS